MATVGGRSPMTVAWALVEMSRPAQVLRIAVVFLLGVAMAVGQLVAWTWTLELI